MPATALTDLSLHEAADLVASRAVSPVDLTQACIDRAEAVDGRLNAYFTRTFDTALTEARKATDEIAAGHRLGPLHGIPFTLKDLYETAGVRTTAGSPLREDFIPKDDAHVVALLKRAGMVLLGKLNMHEWALGASNVNVFFPSPRNPWDIARVTGGSSGGSGAALAAGLCYGSLGSDTRGSIRIPASLCGVTGLKPTYGRVSLRGVVPLSWSLDHAGPMARSAHDCALILNAIAGYDPADPTSIDAPASDYAAGLSSGLKGIRIGLPTNYYFDPDVTQREVILGVLAARDVLRSLGAEIKQVEFPSQAGFGANDAFLADAAAYHEEHLKDSPAKFSDNVRERLTATLSLRAVDYSRSRYQQLELKAALRGLFKEIDLLLVPTTPIVAPLIGDDPARIPNQLFTRNCGAFNVAGLPAISAPCGFNPEGLPIGMQLVGREWEEGLVLRAAHAYQQATDWHLRHPSL